MLKKLLILTLVYTSILNAEEVYIPEENLLGKKIIHEKSQDFNPFTLLAYEQNYILPINYTSIPIQYYNAFNADNQKTDHVDFKFQLSFKTPITRCFFNYDNTLYLAYTQQSFWQAYNHSAFFRANNYQPEVFLENNIEFPLIGNWVLQLINVGLAHQSNGRGGVLERTWNRCYVETTISKECWLFAVRGWWVVKDKSMQEHNPNIQKFLGHGRVLIAHNFNDQVVSLMTYNNIESRFKRGSFQLTYSFPLGNSVRGYCQLFHGFGQSLIEYNHRTNAIGIGISFSDWL